MTDYFPWDIIACVALGLLTGWLVVSLFIHTTPNIEYQQPDGSMAPGVCQLTAPHVWTCRPPQ